MTTRFALCLVTAAMVIAPALAADDVFLKNGKSFEGVIAEISGEQVRIRIGGGEMRLAKSQVLRIEERVTPLEIYLERQRRLNDDPATTAADWLALAWWADRQGLTEPVREAAHAAARRDPGLEGLAPLMGSLGYVRDAEVGDWVTRSEHMKRRGYVLHRGEWLTVEERRLRRAAEAEEQRLAQRIAIERRRLLLAELEARRQEQEEERRRARQQEEAYAQQPVAVAPGFEPGVVSVPFSYHLPVGYTVVQGFFPHRPRPHRQPAPRAPHAGPVLDMFERQPGSLIPGRLVLDRP